MGFENIPKGVVPFNILSDITEQLKKSGQKIVHCHGVFDIVHPGHIKYFKEAKREGDVLIVTITPDKFVDRGPGRPVFNEQTRADWIAEFPFVDYVAINPWPTAEETIKQLKPDIYAKGKEFADMKDETGRIKKEIEALQSVGGKAYFTDTMIASSSMLANNYFNVYTKEAQQFLEQFKKKYSSDYIQQKIMELKSMKILVIGEAIIDEYQYGKPIGKSAKENIISMKYISEERFAGGALATANNIAGFCDSVYIMSLLGNETIDREFIFNHLKHGIIPIFYYDNRPTIKKRRVVDYAFLQKTSELCFLDDSPINQELEEKIIKDMKELLPKFDLVIVSDYGHGFITPAITDSIINHAKFLAVNTQANSANMGFNLINKYPKGDFICIDEPEARLATQDKWVDLKELPKKIMQLGDYKRVIITTGHKGSIMYSEEGCYEIPVFSEKVVDRMGAGDAYLSLSAPCIAKGHPMDLAGFIGNAAGALAVNIVGHRTSIEPSSLYKFITTLLK